MSCYNTHACWRQALLLRVHKYRFCVLNLNTLHFYYATFWRRGFAAQCDVGVYFKQIEPFIKLASIADGQRLSVFLTYLDIPGFQAVCTALDTYQTTYSDVKTFLISRYSSCDIFMERLNFLKRNILDLLKITLLHCAHTWINFLPVLLYSR